MTHKSAVSLSVSNAGPRAVGFQVEWFECRARNNRALVATNPLRWVRIPLSPGTATNLTMKVSPGTTPVEECLCCVGIGWFEPRAAWRVARDRVVIWGFKLLDIDRPSPWKPEHLAQGLVFAANIEVGDYFRRMHGLTRKQWSEELVRSQLPPAHAVEALAPARAAGEALVAVQPFSATNRVAEYEARNAFFAFCQSTTNSTRGAEPVAAPLKPSSFASPARAQSHSHRPASPRSYLRGTSLAPPFFLRGSSVLRTEEERRKNGGRTEEQRRNH